MFPWNETGGTMIKNERQFKITRSQRDKIKSAIDNFDLNAEIDSGINPLIAQAKLDQLSSEFEILCKQVNDYEELSSGEQTEIEVKTLQDLPQALIKARVIRGWTQIEFAKVLKFKPQQVQRYEAENYGTANLSTLMHVANSLDLDLSAIAYFTNRPIEPEKYPIAEMYRRGWFEDFSGTLKQARGKSKELVEKFFVSSGYVPDQQIKHKQKARLGGNVDKHALHAWHARVVRLANSQKVLQEFKKEILTPAWFRNLAMLSQYDDGPILARERLLSSGIYFIVEPHLSNTYLDGAAIRHPNGTPIVALTARYNRLDNFWFVLFHELAHICLHSSNQNYEFFDDLEVEDSDELEKEADNFALKNLLPDEFWNSCLSRFSLDAETVRIEAGQFHVHPSILAGRIRYEQKNYMILNDAVGQNEVSKFFGIGK